MIRKSKPQRVDELFLKQMREWTKLKVLKGTIKSLDRKHISPARATRRLMRCPSWKQIKEEYINIPDGEDK